MGTEELLKEAERQLTICNACRYCEGYCAVFPALEQLREYPKDDVEYLANVCFDCKECYYACQYAPPHEFAVNIPLLLAEVRRETYQEYVSPAFVQEIVKERGDVGFLVRLGAAVFGLAVAASVAVAGPARLFSAHTGPGAFYRVIPYIVLVIAFMLLGAFWLGSWLVEGVRFWRTIKPLERSRSRRPFLHALSDALTLRFLGGGGSGCAYPSEQPSQLRRMLHHLVLYGFLLDVASTVLASIYQHVFHEVPPYPLFHPVVVLGALGGLGILSGGTGLLVLKYRSDQAASNAPSNLQDVIFLVALLSVALTGMLLLAFRSTTAMGALLTIHLGTVAAFFLTAPYMKFKHAVFRFISLIRYHADNAQP